MLIKVRPDEYQGHKIYKSDSPFTDMICELTFKKNKNVTLRMLRCLQKYGFEIEGCYEGDLVKPQK
jgi:hypothetical protein